MAGSLALRSMAVAALSVVAFLAAVGTSAAADFTLEFPAGLACSFPLRLDSTNSNDRVARTFTDKNGVVRTLSAGKGALLTFTNLTTGASLAVKTNGSNLKTTINPDGSQQLHGTGFNVFILFPTDVPAGPSTKLYAGSVTFSVDSNGVFTLQKVTGPTTDICAALTA